MKGVFCRIVIFTERDSIERTKTDGREGKMGV